MSFYSVTGKGLYLGAGDSKRLSEVLSDEILVFSLLYLCFIFNFTLGMSSLFWIKLTH